MAKMMARAQKYINVKDASVDKKEATREAHQVEDKKRKETEREAEGQMRPYNRFDRPRARVNTIRTPRFIEYRPQRNPPRTPQYIDYTPLRALTTPRKQILI